MIPHIIHYCWFGGKVLPRSAQKCIRSWKRFFPDYEIKEWNESNFDVNCVPYVSEAYHAKKYAFVSDFARFWILYNYGGIYFDTDVEVIKPFTEIINAGAFIGCENDACSHNDATSLGINPGLGIGAEAGNLFCREMIERYSTLHFIDASGKTSELNIVHHTTEVFCRHGLAFSSSPQECFGFIVYPKEFFCPIDYSSRLLNATENTVSIHHYAESWIPKKVRFKNFLGRIFGRKFMSFLVKAKNLVKTK